MNVMNVMKVMKANLVEGVSKLKQKRAESPISP